jgi:hypothetical protein
MLMAAGERVDDNGSNKCGAERAAFLYKIIDDNQSTIRFTDTKAAFGIAILSAMLGKVLTQYPLLRPPSREPLAVMVLLGLLSIFGILAAVLAFRVLFPTIDPYKNVRVPQALAPRFFITELTDKSWLRLFSSSDRYSTLTETHAQYRDSVLGAAPEDLISVLCAEVLKLSFIRQIKTDRLIWFARVLTLTVIVFLVLIFLTPSPDTGAKTSHTAMHRTLIVTAPV